MFATLLDSNIENRLNTTAIPRSIQEYAKLFERQTQYSLNLSNLNITASAVVSIIVNDDKNIINEMFFVVSII